MVSTSDNQPTNPESTITTLDIAVQRSPVDTRIYGCGGPLSRLPLELRRMIFSRVFFSTRLTQGYRKTRWIQTSSFVRNEFEWIKIRSAPNSLAILRTCKQIYFEIGDSWLGQVLFNFEDPEAMLDALTQVPTEIVSKIRYVRIRGEYAPADGQRLCNDQSEHFFIHECLDILPGLQLDQLTILADEIYFRGHYVIESLVEKSNGWKELRYITPNSKGLRWRVHTIDRDETDPESAYRAQPAHWQKLIAARDGEHTNPSAKLYRTTSLDQPNRVLNPMAREEFKLETSPEQMTRADSNNAHQIEIDRTKADIVELDVARTQAGEGSKDTLVVIKRGEGVDYEVYKDSLRYRGHLESLVRPLKPRESFRDLIYEACDCEEDWDHYDIPCHGLPHRLFRDTQMDSYRHVDDYVWDGVTIDQVSKEALEYEREEGEYWDRNGFDQELWTFLPTR